MKVVLLDLFFYNNEIKVFTKLFKYYYKDSTLTLKYQCL